MSRITEFAVVRRSVIILLAIALFGTGIYSWSNLQQELLPDIAFPVITIVAPYPGAGATDVTEQVTKPIERAVSGIARLKELQSTSSNSFSVVVAQFSFGTDVKAAQASIQQNLSSTGLPSGVTPTVTALDINQAPVIIASIAASGDQGLADAGRIARTDVVPAIQSLDGVASVDVSGGLEQRIVVTLDPKKLAADGISLAQVNGVLAANNLTLPSGTVTGGDVRIPVSTTAEFSSVDAISRLVVGVKGGAAAAPGGAAGAGAFGGTAGAGASGGSTGSTGATGTSGSATTGQPAPGSATTGTTSGTPTAPTPSLPAAMPTPVTIGDLGTVQLAALPTTGYARTDGSPAVTLTISKQSGANTVAVADEVTAALNAAQARNPGLKITVVSDLSTFIRQSSDGLLHEGGLGAAFAILTIFLFLFSLRSTLVAAMSIPLSILAALTLMLVTGISLNIMTLGGLAVAVGRVVDDAIVVLENIYRHRSRGEEKLVAVRSGAREVSGAITASTATTVMVFLPLGFVGGLVSQFFLPFALTVTFALLASLLCAITVVPVLAYFLVDRVKVDVDETGEPKRSIWVHIYTPTIRFALRNRWTKWAVILLAAVLFVGSLGLVPRIPTQFINAGGQKSVEVVISPPPGTASTAVLDRTIQAEKILDDQRPTVTRITSTVPGEGDTGLASLTAAFSGGAANSARMRVDVEQSTDLNAYAKKLTDLMAPIRTGGYDVTVTANTGFSAGGIDVIVSSADEAQVKTASDAIVADLRKNPDLLNVKSDLANATPEVEVQVDPNRALTAGLTAAQVGTQVRSVLVPSKATRVTLSDGTSLDVYTGIDPTAIASVDALRQVPVGSVGRTVPLGAVANVDQVETQASITRIDQKPAASITGDITSDDTGAVSRAVQKELDALKASGAIPAGVDVRLAGVTEQQNTAFGGLFVSMAVAILLVYVMMVLTFNSLVTPFVILFSLPLATIGAFPALFLSHRPIGISALIGFLMLIGIVVTNAIVLLDLVERLRSEGETTKEALIEGGRTRVRPILMTAIATMLALIPLAAGLNEGSIIAAELGTVVIGGLFSSTFLTLIVVPVVYSLVDGAKRSASRGGARSAGEAVLVPVAATAAPVAPAARAAATVAPTTAPAAGSVVAGSPATRSSSVASPASTGVGSDVERPVIVAAAIGLALGIVAALRALLGRRR